MKIFINLENQIDDEKKLFAFYCTVTDNFEVFSCNQTWESKKDFIEDYYGNDIERYLNLIPDGWDK